MMKPLVLYLNNCFECFSATKNITLPIYITFLYYPISTTHYIILLREYTTAAANRWLIGMSTRLAYTKNQVQALTY